MTSGPSRPQLPDGVELLESFMKFPASLALTNREGTMVLVNETLSARFGAVVLDPESVRAAAASRDETCPIALRARDQASVVNARVGRTRDRILLELDDPAPTVELEGLRARVAQLERLAATDHLTGAWNRAHFDRSIAAELARSLAGRQPVSLVLIDVDHFKKVNDTFGHGVGDAVLRELVSAVQARIRASDVLFRWGGEEFAILTASAGYRGAGRLAENLCAAVAAHPFPEVGTVTVSLGVAEHDGDEAPAAWFARLDAALYAAKDGGRNQAVVDRRGNSDTWAREAGLSTLHLVWQEAFESGEPRIDDDHRELFVRANRLIDDACNNEPGMTAAGGSLDSFLAHVGRHFAAEEAILASVHYAELEKHKLAHAGLLRRAAHFRARVVAGEASLGGLVEFLAQDVVARHLMTVDRAFFPLFEKAG